MRAVVQRVDARVGRRRAARSAPGLCVLLGVAEGDDEAGAAGSRGKVARSAIFENDEGKFDRSLLDTGGEALVVSQFTLLGRHGEGQPAELHGRGAARARRAALRAVLRRASRARASTVATGVFGARMELELVNDGPVTIVLEADAAAGCGIDRRFAGLSATVLSPHFGTSKWARRAHFSCKGWFFDK